jgi:4-hydroxy-tetrahydrodipicolinate reductase
MNIGICGATGRIGRIIVQKLADKSFYTVSATFSRKNHIDDLAEFCQNCDVIIDFSSNEILDKLLDYAEIYKNKLVIGTTGLHDYQFERLKEVSQKLTIFYSANMSLGANLLAMLAGKVAKILDNTYDIEITDCHHRDKKDAPSGTALMLGESVAEARNLNFKECLVLDRSTKGQRLINEIGINSIRGGQIHGDHEVLFLGNDQIISMKHQALNKDSFAEGAIWATSWISDKPAGLYSMKEALLML